MGAEAIHLLHLPMKHKMADIEDLSIHQSDSVKGTTDISTTSTTYVDMPGMSLTMTTGANPVLIIFSACFQYYQKYFGLVQLLVDDTREHCARFDDWTPCSMIVLKTLTAGSHTFKMQWRIEVLGTLYQYGAAYPRWLIVIELKK